MILTTWCGSKIEVDPWDMSSRPARTYYLWLMGWIRALVRRALCRHDFWRSAHEDYHFDVGRNKMLFWRCRKCGKAKSRPVW